MMNRGDFLCEEEGDTGFKARVVAEHATVGITCAMPNIGPCML